MWWPGHVPASALLPAHVPVGGGDAGFEPAPWFMLTCQRESSKTKAVISSASLTWVSIQPEGSSDPLTDWLAVATPTFRLDPGEPQGWTETFSSEQLQGVFQIFMLGVMELKLDLRGPHPFYWKLWIYDRCVSRCAWSRRGSTTMPSSRKWERKRQPSPSSSRSWERSNLTLQTTAQDLKGGAEEQPSKERLWGRLGGGASRGRGQCSHSPLERLQPMFSWFSAASTNHQIFGSCGVWNDLMCDLSGRSLTRLKRSLSVCQALGSSDGPEAGQPGSGLLRYSCSERRPG